jgi:hypothetical protein
MKILVAVPTTFRGVSPYFINTFANTILELIPKYDVITRVLISGEPIDKVRSFLAEYAIQQKADYILFIDDDISFDVKILHYILSLNLPFVSGIYTTRNGTTNILKKIGDKYIGVDKINENGLIKVDAVGLGCSLIHTKILKKVKEISGDYFIFTHNLITNEGYGEDVWFSDQVGKLGIPIYVNTNWKCSHFIIKSV